MSEIVLGLNSAYHESAACLIREGQVVCAAEEERFNRVKHAKAALVDNPHELPWSAISYCVDRAGVRLSDVSYIGFSLNPAARRANASYDDVTCPRSWGTREGEETFIQRAETIPGQLREAGFDGRFLWLDHHQCHLASAFYTSPHDIAALLSVDGIGETTTTAFATGSREGIQILDRITYPHSLGFLWEKISEYIGFGQYDACKVMGLAAFGNRRRYADEFARLVEAVPRGQFRVDHDVLRFRAADFGPLEALFRLKRRVGNAPLTSEHHDVAAALQTATEDIMLHMASSLRERTGLSNLCLAGGVALNCVANRVVCEDAGFDSVFIQPAPHDAGTALGAAFLAWDSMTGSPPGGSPGHTFLGPSFSDREIEDALQARGLSFEREPAIERRTALLLGEGKLVGWFQGAMEFGPRALGHRSLLADPRDPDVAALLNARIKRREAFRPFGPSVLAERASEWFMMSRPTPAAEYMLVAYPVEPSRSAEIPAVLHIDGTSRIQLVHANKSPRYHRLISEFHELTGVPMVLNTSFNDSEPIVCRPADAIRTFLKTGIDYLVLGNYLVRHPDRGDG